MLTTVKELPHTNVMQALQDDVETLQPNVDNIEITSEKLLSNADPKFAEELRLKVETLIGKWKKVVEGAKKQNVRLKDALEKSKMVRFHDFHISHVLLIYSLFNEIVNNLNSIVSNVG